MNYLSRVSPHRSTRNDFFTPIRLEPLESRLLLCAVDSKSCDAHRPPAGEKIDIGPWSFSANPGSGGAVTGGPEVSINVGPVVNISRATGNQTEADIAINPTNPDQLFGVSNITSGTGLFMAVSNDAGVNWTTRVGATGADIPGACCDARVEYDSFGNLYLVYLGPGGSGIFVARSTNNGANFTLIHSKSGSWDNPAIDVGSGNQVWIESRAPGGVGAFGFQATGLGTVDGSIGVSGFTATQLVPTTSSTGNFGDIAVLNDGSLLISYTTPSGGQGPANDPIWRDADGFGPAGFTGAGGGTTTPLLNTPTNVGGFDFIPAQNGRSVDSEPSFNVAPPGTPFAGRAYFVYSNETVAENHDHDIIMRYSDDGGLTWTNEIRINDDPSSPIRSQFLAQIAVDPTTGAIVVSWHDSRNDDGVLPNGTNGVANDDAQFFGALSTDGGVTWQNFLIDPGWSNAVRANNGIDYGDWTGSDFYNGRFYAIWASNAQGTNGLPNNPSPNQFDLATARVDIIGAGLPGVYGLVFDDANNNGTREGGELGLTGVTIFDDANNNGSPDGGEATQLTGSGGSYGFTGLAAGTYRFKAVTPGGLRLTFPGAGEYVVNYDGATTLTASNFGFVNPRIAGTVFDDANDNGVFDVAEGGMVGVTVFIDTNNNGNLDGGEPSVASGAGGAYTLGGLLDGSYFVRAVTPAGRRLTFPAAGSYNDTVGGANLVFTARNFGLTNRVRIGGVVYNDANGNGNRDGGEAGINGTRVYQDLNNNGLFDNTGGTFNSVDVPKPINDNTTMTSDLIITGGGNITNLTVTIGSLIHTYDGDLVLTLISPLGTRVTLSNRRGGTGENFINTVFDDAAAVPIGSGTPPYTGSFRPEQLLSVLNGQNANGTWELEVADQASVDVGSLNAWSITFGSTEPNQLSTAIGEYNFNGLGAGTYNIRQEPIGGQTQTEPASGVYNLVLAGGALVSDADFGNSSLVPPNVNSTQFVFDGVTLPAAPHQLKYSFSQNVGGSIDASDLQLFNSTGSFTVPTGFISASYDSGTNTATFTFPGYTNGVLPNGQYTATLLAAGVFTGGGTPLPANAVSNFFVLAGDANHDGSVSSDDFNILATNFGLSGRIFSQGDFTYNGTVDSDDFNILAGNFGVSVGAGAFATGRIAPARLPRMINILNETQQGDDDAGASLDLL